MRQIYIQSTAPTTPEVGDYWRNTTNNKWMVCTAITPSVVFTQCSHSIYPSVVAAAYVGGTTGYFAYYGTYTGVASAQQKLVGGVLVAMSVNITTNNTTGTFTVNKNGVNTALTISVGDSVIGNLQATNVGIAILKSDLICIEGIIAGNPAKAMTFRGGNITVAK